MGRGVSNTSASFYLLAAAAPAVIVLGRATKDPREALLNQPATWHLLDSWPNYQGGVYWVRHYLLSVLAQSSFSHWG